MRSSPLFSLLSSTFRLVHLVSVRAVELSVRRMLVLIISDQRVCDDPAAIIWIIIIVALRSSICVGKGCGAVNDREQNILRCSRRAKEFLHDRVGALLQFNEQVSWGVTRLRKRILPRDEVVGELTYSVEAFLPIRRRLR